MVLCSSQRVAATIACLAERAGLEPAGRREPPYGLAIRCITTLPTLHWCPRGESNPKTTPSVMSRVHVRRAARAKTHLPNPSHMIFAMCFAASFRPCITRHLFVNVGRLAGWFLHRAAPSLRGFFCRVLMGVVVAAHRSQIRRAITRRVTFHLKGVLPPKPLLVESVRRRGSARAGDPSGGMAPVRPVHAVCWKKIGGICGTFERGRFLLAFRPLCRKSMKSRRK